MTSGLMKTLGATALLVGLTAMPGRGPDVYPEGNPQRGG